jgi:hypothetical protein
MDEQEKREYWLDRSENVTRLYRILIGVCVLLFVPDLLDLAGVFYHKHVHYRVEGWVGFYAIFGFLAYSFIVVGGWAWRKVVMREEDYYDR